MKTASKRSSHGSNDSPGRYRLVRKRPTAVEIAELVEAYNVEEGDEWDEITASESPEALSTDATKKRSGEYQRAELARLLEECKS